MARGDARENSDIDLLIDIVGPTTPWFPGGLLADLETALGRRVDIVIARSLHGCLSSCFSLDFVFTFEVTPDRVFGHFARFFQGRAKGTNLRDRRHEHTEPAFW